MSRLGSPAAASWATRRSLGVSESSPVSTSRLGRPPAVIEFGARLARSARALRSGGRDRARAGGSRGSPHGVRRGEGPPPGRPSRGRAPVARQTLPAPLPLGAAGRSRGFRPLRGLPHVVRLRARGGRRTPPRARPPRPPAFALRPVRRGRVGRGRHRSATARSSDSGFAAGRTARRRRGGHRARRTAEARRGVAGREPRAAKLAWTIVGNFSARRYR